MSKSGRTNLLQYKQPLEIFTYFGECKILCQIVCKNILNLGHAGIKCWGRLNKPKPAYFAKIHNEHDKTILRHLSDAITEWFICTQTASRNECPIFGPYDKGESLTVK